MDNMKRMMHRIAGLAAAAALLAGCAEKNPAGEAEILACRGRLAVGATTSAGVATRADTDLKTLVPGLTVPVADQLKLVLKGDNIAEIERTEDGRTIVISRFNYSEEWETLDLYDEPDLYPGLYRATLTHGDPEAVGRNVPYYKGEADAEVEINERTRCSVKVQIANALVRVQTSELFAAYFTEPQFRLVVDGEPTEFVLTAAAGEQPVFVPAGAEITWLGSVRRPSQTSADDREGELYEFEVPARTAVARTIHTFVFTAEAGSASGGIEVTFEEAPAGGDYDFEMNPDGAHDTGEEEGKN